jgi:hypothetical protein
MHPMFRELFLPTQTDLLAEEEDARRGKPGQARSITAADGRPTSHMPVTPRSSAGGRGDGTAASLAAAQSALAGHGPGAAPQHQMHRDRAQRRCR